jgi:hypothetical protein
MEWFHQAGLTDVQLFIQPRRVKYQGHKDMRPYVLDWLALEAGDSGVPDQQGQERRGITQQILSTHQHMIEMGLLDDETVKRAKSEAWAFYSDPGAFQFWLEVFAVGRVP